MALWTLGSAGGWQSVVAFLDKWQSLLGGLIGGVVAISAALIVAYSGRRREDRAAATLVFSKLDELRITAEAVEEAATEKGQSFVECAREVGDLPGAKPSLTFRETIFRLSTADEGVGVYLDAVGKLIRMADNQFDRARALQGKNEEQVEESLRSGLMAFMDAAEHARLALPGVGLVMRPGLWGACRRFIRRYRIRLGRLLRGKVEIVYPKDVRPALPNSSPLEDEETWKDRLQEPLEIKDLDAWISGEEPGQAGEVS